MPIDIVANFKSTSNTLANKSLVGTILGNPIAVGVMVVLSLFFILYYFNGVSLTFKFMFYSSVAIIGILLAHDIILKEQLSEFLEVDKDDQIVKDVQNIQVDNPVQPRGSADQIRQNHLDSMPSSNLSYDDLQRM